jgi:zinc D-Ala-D-Ala carboxypeptidase
VRGSIAAVALAVVAVAGGVWLWATWDSTQAANDVSVNAGGGRPIRTTTTTAPAAPSTPPTTLPPCVFGDQPTEGEPDTDWATIVIDTERRLPAEYYPNDLWEVTAAGFAQGARVRQFVIGDLAALRQTAETNGTPIVVASGYRSYDSQQRLFDDEVARVGEAQATTTVARAGHSEHQLGTAIDVLDPAATELTPAFADTPAGQWIAAHAHEFGFVLSYPAGAGDRTCYEFEPWHLRYVGKGLAAQIHASGAPAREWLLRNRAPSADAN